jgi:hypothetical protein
MRKSYAGFEFLTEVVMKSTNLRDITPHSPSKDNQIFEGVALLALFSGPENEGDICLRNFG